MLYELNRTDGGKVWVVADQMVELSVTTGGTSVRMLSGAVYPIKASQADAVQAIMEMCHPTVAPCIMAVEPRTADRAAAVDVAKVQAAALASTGQPGMVGRMPDAPVPHTRPLEQAAQDQAEAPQMPSKARSAKQ